MMDPPRLRDQDGSIADMLTAARTDGPRNGTDDRRRLVAALAAMERPALAATETASRAAIPRWAIGVLAGAGIALIGSISLYSATTREHAPTTSPASITGPVAPDVAQNEGPVATPPSITVTAVSDLPTAAPTARSSVSRSGEPTPKTKPGASSLDELAAVELVRTQLTGGDVAGARRALASYHATFAQGRFHEEIDALEVELLAAEGAGSAARTKALEFASRYPSSPYARRVRSAAKLDEATP